MNHHYINYNNEEESNIEVQKKSKNSKKIKKNSKDSSIGKPKGLNQVCIDRPDIWTLDENSLKLISYLLKLGRHILVNSHTNLSKQSEEKKMKIQQYKETNKPIIQHLQFIAEYLFEYPCQKYKVVYFFRDNQICQKKKQIIIGGQLNNLELQNFLKKTYFLFNDKFILELQRLFEMFEEQKTNENISEILIQESLNNNTENQTQIIQSMYISIQKNADEIELFSKVSSSNLEKQKNNFYQTIKDSKVILSEIIMTIRNIFYENSDIQYSNQNPSIQNQYDESNYIDYQKQY